MSRLMRASEIEGRPVVTRAGDDVAQIKDIVFSAAGGAVGGFTLAGRGLLAGPKKEALAWSDVSALGADAVIIDSEAVYSGKDDVIHASASSGGSGGDVLGSQVLTDAGTELGEVIDVILSVGESSEECDVVGYEVKASDSMASKGTKLLIPLPDTIAASGEHLVVPDSAKDFVGDDLAGFGAAVSEFRSQLEAR